MLTLSAGIVQLIAALPVVAALTAPTAAAVSSLDVLGKLSAVTSSNK